MFLQSMAMAHRIKADVDDVTLVMMDLAARLVQRVDSASRSSVAANRFALIPQAQGGVRDQQRNHSEPRVS